MLTIFAADGNWASVTFGDFITYFDKEFKVLKGLYIDDILVLGSTTKGLNTTVIPCSVIFA